MKFLYSAVFLFISCLCCDKSHGAQKCESTSATSRSCSHEISSVEKFVNACEEIESYCLSRRTFVPQTLESSLFNGDLILDFKYPLDLAYLITEWMTCVIWHKAKVSETTEPKFDGSSFYGPVYKPMMFYLLSLQARLNLQNACGESRDEEDTVKSVETLLSELMSNPHDERDKQVLSSLNAIFQDNESRIAKRNAAEDILVATKDVLNNTDTNSSIDDFASVFVNFMKGLCPPL